MELEKYNELMLRCFKFPSSESRLLYFIESLTRYVEAYEKALHSNWELIHQRAEWLLQSDLGLEGSKRRVGEMGAWESPFLPSEIIDFIHADMWDAMLPTFQRITEIGLESDKLVGRTDPESIRQLQQIQLERTKATDDSLNLFRDYRTGCFAMLDEVRRRPNIESDEKNDYDSFSSSKLKADVERWLSRPRKLGGPTEGQHKFISYLVEQEGRAKPADISTACGLDYEDPRDGCHKLVKRIRKRIGNSQPWDIAAEDRGEVAIFECPENVPKLSH